MAKPEWGTKRTCPKCGERFYDLQKDDPIVCIECGTDFKPEPILKTKQPIVIEEKADSENTDDDDLDLDDDDLDVSGDDDIDAVSLDDDDDDEVSSMVDTSLSDDDQ